ncbi:hypothetical protein HPB48_002677 [Haemaphysalis longicornis]|uniref:Uncharacterized protein n=1 Tax=Haemaphysalis longicornis TaxID=44386 RepID=A0A9J6FTE6_HAELO|nr:hypothetical protein HPB48_002677 [Haemaphysalis longicornis]
MGATRADDAPRPAAKGHGPDSIGRPLGSPPCTNVGRCQGWPEQHPGDAGPVRDRGPSPGPGPFDGGTPKNRWAGPTGLPSLSHGEGVPSSLPLPPLLLPLTKAFQPLNVANARI